MNDRDIDILWERLKNNFPIGHQFYGEVISVKPYGIFVDLGYRDVHRYQLNGIIDIATQSDRDLRGLFKETFMRSQVGQQVHCKVIAYREYNKEVDLRLIG